MTQREQLFSVHEAAERLGLRERQLFQRLRADKVFTPNNLPEPAYRERGLFRVQNTNYEIPGAGRRVSSKALVTIEGLRWLETHYAQAAKAA